MGAGTKTAKRRKKGDFPDARDAAMLRFSEEYHEKHGYRPSTREMAAAAGFSSTSSAQGRIEKLKAAGYLASEAGRGASRAHRLTPAGLALAAEARRGDGEREVSF